MIHVPKTGGSWCRQAIASSGIPSYEAGKGKRSRKKHSSLSEVQHLIDNKRTFGFVRHPLTWVQSKWAYAMFAQNPRNKQHDIMDESFHVFVERFLTSFPSQPSISMLCKLGFEQDGNDWIEVHKIDFIGRNENLTEDLIEALKNEKFDKQALRNEPPKKVTSRAKEWKDRCQYTPELERAVVEQNKFLINTFYDTIDTV